MGQMSYITPAPKLFFKILLNEQVFFHWYINICTNECTFGDTKTDPVYI